MTFAWVRSSDPYKASSFVVQSSHQMFFRTSILLSLLGAACTIAQTPPSNLPPAPTGVFTAQASITIDAPIDHVWDILLDFSHYADWNPFVR